VKFYLTQQGGWETAIERAGKDAQLVMVPTDNKAAMLEWLAAWMPAPPSPPTIEPELGLDPATVAVPALPAAGGHCPNCGMSRRDAMKAATAYFDNLTAGAIADKVMELDGHQLGNVLNAGAQRLRELEKRALAIPAAAESQPEPQHETA